METPISPMQMSGTLRSTFQERIWLTWSRWLREVAHSCKRTELTPFS